MASKLKYSYALTKEGKVVRAEDISTQLRLSNNNEFFVEGFLPDMHKAMLPVVAVIGKKKRSHFREYSDPKKQIEGFIHDKKHFNELMIHILAKQEIAKLSSIVLPPCIYKYNGNSVVISQPKMIAIRNVEIEKRFKTSRGDVIYDSYIQVGDGSELGLEVYVTHKVDEVKYMKIEELNHNVLELDLSDLVDKVDNIDVANVIRDRLNDFSKLCWVRNLNHVKMNTWRNSLVAMNINRAEYTSTIGNSDIKDAWYVWASDYIGRIEKCPYKDKINEAIRSNFRRNKYIESNQCKSCGRCLIVENDARAIPKSICGRMLCNQSDIDNQEILSMIVESFA